MSNIFLISDTHFGHDNILKFTIDEDGTLLRPGFANAEEMDQHMVDMWNKTVGIKDKVYHLGDVTMHHKHLPILDRLNGEKVLIKGNHDTGKISQYLKYFKDVRGTHQLDRLLLSHIPIHPASLSRWRANVHGHLHSNEVMRSNDVVFDRVDKRYLCVSVERIKYTPSYLEEVNACLNLR